MRHFFCDSLKRFFVAFVATLAFVAPTFAAANLPSGYTELEYIKSDGTGYIDTDIVPGGKKIGMQAGFKYESLQPATATIIGSGTSDGVDNCRLWGTFNSKWRIKLANQGMSYGTPDTNYHEVRVNMSDGGAYLDGTKVWNVSQITIPSTNTKVLRLFSDNAGGGTSSSSRIYYVRLYQDNDTLIAEYIPAKNSSNEIGFYDTKNNRFLTAPSTFTAGPAIQTYTMLEYIEGTGTQYIDTGVACNNISNIELEVKTTANSGTQWIFGSYVSSNNALDIASQNNGNKLILDIGSSSVRIISNVISYDGFHKIVANISGREFIIDNVSQGTASVAGAIPSTNAFLSGAYYNNAGAGGKEMIKYCKIKDSNGTLVRNFVPARRDSDGRVGMLDTLTNTFYDNAASATVNFEAGPDLVTNGAIKIATTKYTEDAFAGLMTTLSEAITKVTNIVDTTVQQATEIGNLATTKQDRPDTDCPAGRKCLLIMGADNKPHWYLIQE